MPRKILFISFLFAASAFAAFSVKIYQPSSDAVELTSVADAREKLAKSGLFCASLHEDIMLALVVSDRPLSITEATEFQVRHSTTDQTGKVLLLSAAQYEQGPNWRHWGNISATGDLALLDRLEGLLR